MTTTEYIKKIPKIDLHCHLDGSMPLATIRELGNRCQIKLPENDKELLELLQVTDGCQSLNEYLKKFVLPLDCLCTKESFHTAAFQLMEHAVSENVMYIEMRFAPLLSVREDLSGKDIVEGVLEGVKEAEEKYEIKGNVIICCMRHFTMEENLTTIGLANCYKDKGVCAIDLAGDESSFPTSGYQYIFERAKELNLTYTIHGGECGNVEDVRSAINFGASRIGHGIALIKDPGLYPQVRDQKIGIEMCPISNLHTKAVENLEQYPIQNYIDEGILVTVNTDNRMVSGTSITKEFLLLNEGFDLDFVQLIKNAIEVSFADQSTKEWMRNKLDSFKNNNKI